LAGQRLDRLVSVIRPEISRAAGASMIERGLVLINGRPSKAASRPLAGARLDIEIPAPPSSDALPEDIPLSIVYEDASLVVVDKPAGMVVHPAPGNEHGTLVNALLGRYSSLPGDPTRPGIVHRLDKDTSGLIVVARTPTAVTALARSFKHREVHKEYIALILGTLRPQSGAISSAIGRDPRHRQRMAVLATGGRDARTTYRTEETFKHFSLVRIGLETGRMHQIRVHFSALGHPVIGDPVYGRPIRGLALRRQFLHAAQLSFRHPETGEEMVFRSDLPDDLSEILDNLRGNLGKSANEGALTDHSQ
ncbi:MAG: pseudouridine synthase, RluA family, partial [Chloroflexi bacterium]|nr:pseudouridine synthase, RluA family [Chloroflexota bacterium]